MLTCIYNIINKSANFDDFVTSRFETPVEIADKPKFVEQVKILVTDECQNRTAGFSCMRTVSFKGKFYSVSLLSGKLDDGDLYVQAELIRPAYSILSRVATDLN